MWECHFLTIQRMGPDGIKGSKITFNVQLLAITIFYFWRAYFCRCLSHLLSSALSDEKWLLVTRVYTGPLSITRLWQPGVLWPRPILSEAPSFTEGLWPAATGHCTHCTLTVHTVQVYTNHPLDSHLSRLSSLRMAGAGAHWTEPTPVTRSLSSGIGSSPLENTIHWMYRIQLSAKEGYLIYQHAQ